MNDKNEVILSPSSEDLWTSCTPENLSDDSFCIGRLNTQDIYVQSAQVGPEEGIRSLRDIQMEGIPHLVDIFTRASEMLTWRNHHRYCGKCGGSCSSLGQEPAMKCTRCGHLAYPVLSPVVMIRIRKGDRILLARNSRYGCGNYSLIAGFVEAGESLEQAIAREIKEEVGIEVKNIRYFSSQSWPMPHSLLAGYTADYASGDLQPDGEEILEAHWLDPRNTTAIPRKGSLARELIDDFIAELKGR